MLAPSVVYAFSDWFRFFDWLYNLLRFCWVLIGTDPDVNLVFYCYIHLDPYAICSFSFKCHVTRTLLFDLIMVSTFDLFKILFINLWSGRLISFCIPQVDVCCSDGTFARAAVPSGASTGRLYSDTLMYIASHCSIAYLCHLYCKITGLCPNCRCLWSFGVERWWIWLPGQGSFQGLPRCFIYCVFLVSCLWVVFTLIGNVMFSCYACHSVITICSRVICMQVHYLNFRDELLFL